MEVGKCKLELLRAALTCTTVDVVNVAGTMGESCVPFFLFLFFFFFPSFRFPRPFYRTIPFALAAYPSQYHR